MSGRSAAQRGFTILEMLISLSLFLVVMLTVTTTMLPSKRLQVTGERRADMQQNARLAMAEITKQIRMAGYFPENFANPAASPLLNDPVIYASESALAIHGDADGSGSSGAVLYCLDGNGALRRTSGAINVEATYACSGGDVMALNATALRFAYFDEDGDPLPDPTPASYSLDGQDLVGVPALDDTTLRGAVRSVEVTLTTQSTLPDQRTQQYTLTSEVSIRNLQ